MFGPFALAVTYRVAADTIRAFNEFAANGRDGRPARSSPVTDADADPTPEMRVQSGGVATDGGEIIRDDEVDHHPGENPPAPAWAPEGDDYCVKALVCANDYDLGEGWLFVLEGGPETDDAWMFAPPEDMQRVEQ